MSVVVVLIGVACTSPPDPEVVKVLTTGVWHTRMEGDDYIYQFTYEGEALHGSLHQISQGKQLHEIPVPRVTILGTAVGFNHGRFPPYSGEFCREKDHIVGGIPGEPRFREMNLTRVAPTDWPMIQPGAVARPADGSYLWTQPQELDDDWHTADLSEAGIDQTAVEATVRRILAGRAGNVHSLLVVRDGKLVVEEYFYGWDRNDLHPILSCTKSVVSLLVGIATDQGSLSGVDMAVMESFPEYAPRVDRSWETVHLEHLLTMTAGLDWGPGEAGTPPQGNDRYADVLAHEIVDRPGTRFAYVGRGVDLFSGVLLAATGVEADAFADENLFTPLGISDWDWQENRWQGHPDMSHELKMRPRDMAKLGQLVLDEGLWQGQRVVSSEWIRESTSTHIPETPFGVQYGYLWWRVDPPPPNMPLGTVTFANGVGGQFIAIVPEAGLVVVSSAGNYFNGRQFDIVELTRRHLLPGIGSL